MAVRSVSFGYRYLNHIRDQREQGTVDMVSDLQSDCLPCGDEG